MNQQEHMQRHLSRWQESGQSIASYCRAHGLKEYSFHYWRTKLTITPSAEGAAEFFTLSPRCELAEVPGLQIRYPNGVSIELPRAASLELIRSLIHL